ncbi:Calx-beta domain-containing protein [Brachymonas chironomi]|uniref:Calx-beta domain-containing protein n=1 Tax=Brachymonas chironomi TaxID=491919 RepID=UPI0003A1E1F5|nr:Calx-beta domain-containing protein [Brachymonas chironomi]
MDYFYDEDYWFSTSRMVTDENSNGLIDLSEKANLTIRDVTVDESAGVITFDLVLDKRHTKEFTIDWSTADGSALAGSDYQARQGTVTFLPHQIQQRISIPIINDSLAENAEFFTINLTNLQGEGASDIVIGNQSATAVIGKNDSYTTGIPSITTSHTYVDEGNGYVEVTLQLNAATTEPVSFEYYPYGFQPYGYLASYTEDFVANGYIKINFNPGETVKSVRVPINDDQKIESLEYFELSLTSPENVFIPNNPVIGIVDNDKAIIDINRNGLIDDIEKSKVSIHDAFLDAHSGIAFFDITLDKKTSIPFTLDWHTSDGTAINRSDYIASHGTISFAAGQVHQRIPVAIPKTSTRTNLEYFNIKIDNASSDEIILGKDTAAATIGSNQTQDQITISVEDAVANESDGSIKFVVKLSSASTHDIKSYLYTSDGSAKNGSGSLFDYNQQFHNFTFIPGETVKVVQVTLTNNTIQEPVEIFYAHLGYNDNVATLKQTATAVIHDDDGTNPVHMAYGYADNIYHITGPKQIISELPNAGIDTVYSSISYNLQATNDSGYFADNIENLTLTGSAPINGLGNQHDNILIGNSGNNLLSGGQGSDFLYGQGGDDTLIGGYGINHSGQNLLDGGTGQDTVDYSDSTSSVIADLTAMFAEIPEDHITERLISIERLIGSSYNDTLTGNTDDNTLRGGKGNDTLSGVAGNNVLYGEEGNDRLLSGVGTDLLDGADGIDTADYSNAVRAVNVSLTIAGAQDTQGAGTDTLVSIEALAGSRFDDVLTGNNLDNTLDGAEGNDTLVGNAGNDSLQGGAGNDTLEGGMGDDLLDGGEGNDVINGGSGSDTATYALAATGVTVDLSNSRAQDTVGSGTDTLISIENLQGSQYDDILKGNANSNTLSGEDGNDILDGGGDNDLLFGGNGNDTLISGVGNDLLDGGWGNDTASYATAGKSVTVNLALSDAQDTQGAGLDTLRQIENLIGSDYDDILIGNEHDNIIQGGLGNDIIMGGYGHDTIDGGDGIDTADYSDYSDMMYISLLESSAYRMGSNYYFDYHDYGISTLKNIENVRGTSHDDSITGNSYNNIIYGGDGHDIIEGHDGDDYLYGESGDDYLYGGEGNDVLVGGDGNDHLLGGSGNDTLIDTEGYNTLDGGDGIDTIDFSQLNAAILITLSSTSYQTIGDYYNTILNIENVYGSQYDDTIFGDDNNNILHGNAGADSLYGDTGDDRLYGGDGNDLLFVSAGNNHLYGGSGDDYILSAEGNDHIDGGSGIDTLDFHFASDGVTVNLALTGAQDTRHAGLDTIRHVENIAGTDFDDKLTGNTENNILHGNAGNDILTGAAGHDALYGGEGDDTLNGGVGNDILDGGAGTDTAYYTSASSAVTINLAHTTAQNTLGAGIDTLKDIENITGSRYHDKLTGDAGRNLLRGESGNDTLVGSAGNDILLGGYGNDVLNGGVDNDYLDGGAGTDTAYYGTATAAVTVSLALTGAQDTLGAGVDTLRNFENLTGSRYNDKLTGNASDNILRGESGHDVLTGGAGNDYLLGGYGNDILNGGVGNDLMDGGAGTDTAHYSSATTGVNVSLALTGSQDTKGAGTDTLRNIENITGSRYNDRLTGNTADNLLRGESGNDTLVGGAGNDTLLGGYGNDTLNGGAGNDYLDGSVGTDTAYYATATSAVTVSLALTGAQDTKGAGMDTLRNIENITGSRYHDKLTGNAGNNLLRGESGNDTLVGGAGNDILWGGYGNDILNGGVGNDILDGGAGIDTAYYASSTAAVTVNLTLTTAQDTLGAGTDTLRNMENITGSRHNDSLTGDAGDNTLRGESGNDILNGGGGNDLLSGGYGNDQLIGGAGSDVLIGGAGRDIFIFNAQLGSENIDRIIDFTATEDSIRLDNAVFSQILNTGTLNSAYFVSNTQGVAQDGNDYIVYNTTTGALSYDADGSGSGAAVQFATLLNGVSVNSSNFMVI